MKHPLVLAALLSLLPFTAAAGPLGGARPARPADHGQRPALQQRETVRDREHPSPSEQQQANLAALKEDLAAIQSGSTVTAEQKAALKDSLHACADGATKPSEESVSALSESLSAALADGKLSNKEKALLSKQVQAVLNSAGIPQEEVDALVAATTELLTASGVTKSEAQEVARDLQAIAAELKANAPAVPARNAGSR